MGLCLVWTALMASSWYTLDSPIAQMFVPLNLKRWAGSWAELRRGATCLPNLYPYLLRVIQQEILQKWSNNIYKVLFHDILQIFITVLLVLLAQRKMSLECASNSEFISNVVLPVKPIQMMRAIILSITLCFSIWSILMVVLLKCMGKTRMMINALDQSHIECNHTKQLAKILNNILVENFQHLHIFHTTQMMSNVSSQCIVGGILFKAPWIDSHLSKTVLAKRKHCWL